MRAAPPVIGLTGGIGSGKSLVASRLQALGATVVDSDEISRALTAAGGEAMPALREAFGAAFVTADGALDRDAMRDAQILDVAPVGHRQLLLQFTDGGRSNQFRPDARVLLAIQEHAGHVRRRDVFDDEHQCLVWEHA